MHSRFFIVALNLIALVGLLATLNGRPALAGFEFLPQGNTQGAQPAPVNEMMQNMPEDETVSGPSEAPAVEAEMLPLEPLMIEDTAAAPAPAPVSSEPILKVKTVEPPAPRNSEIANSPMLPEPTLVVPEDAPDFPVEAVRTPPPPVRRAAPAEIATTAPSAPPSSGKLVINPFPKPVKSTMPVAAPQPVTRPAPVKQAMPAPAAPMTFDDVVGFGSDMPLALALRQVVPPEFSFAFGDGVNPGYRVSWNGGKPWNEVVSEMIEPLNLRATITAKTVHIQTASPENHSAAKPAQPEQNFATAETIQANDPGELAALQRLETQAAQEIAALKPAAGENTGAVVRWEAKKGESLKQTLSNWAESAQVSLVWKAAHDYTLESDVTINNSFRGAVNDLLQKALTDDKPSYSMFPVTEGEYYETLVISDHNRA